MKVNYVLFGGTALTAFLIWAARQQHDLHSEIIINAPPEQVWQALTDTTAYPHWNPVIVRLEGQLLPGQRIEFENHDASGRSMVFHPTILKADAGRELRWLGHLGLRGLFDGEHYFKLTALPDGNTKLEHGEHFSGLLIPFTRQWLNGSILNGFKRLNQALKARIEKAAA